MSYPFIFLDERPQVNELFMEPNYFFSHRYKQNQFFQGETKITRMITPNSKDNHKSRKKIVRKAGLDTDSRD